MISVSIVSHGHGEMVRGLVCKVLQLPEVSEVLVTLNIPEQIPLPVDGRLRILKNKVPKGFGANHNSAFELSSQPYFCPMNPDIGLNENPFPALLNLLLDSRFGMAVPRVDSPSGTYEDSWRHFPTFSSLVKKSLGWNDGRYAFPSDRQPFVLDWAAGMFMLFQRTAFTEIGGFDEGFFLYYEDVDICVRLWRKGYPIVAVPDVAVVHDARRDSHRKLGHLWWHFLSMLRYFYKHGWQVSHVRN